MMHVKTKRSASHLSHLLTKKLNFNKSFETSRFVTFKLLSYSDTGHADGKSKSKTRQQFIKFPLNHVGPNNRNRDNKSIRMNTNQTEKGIYNSVCVDE